MDALKKNSGTFPAEKASVEGDETALVTTWLENIVTANSQQIEQIRPILYEAGATQPGDLLRLFQNNDEGKAVIQQISDQLPLVKRWKVEDALLTGKVMEAPVLAEKASVELVEGDETALVTTWLENICHASKPAY